MRRKMSFLLHASAIIVSVSAAFAFSQSPAQDAVQYYKVGDNYYPAGTYGVDYVCEWDVTSTCTYYYNPQTGKYVPSKIGRILFVR